MTNNQDPASTPPPTAPPQTTPSQTTPSQTAPSQPRRPRPQFGELATPEEQRAAIAVPGAALSPEPVPVEADRPAKPSGEAARSSRTAEPTLAETTGASAASGRAPLDRFISWGLLGLGLFTVLQSTIALFDLPTVIDGYFAFADLDPYGPVAVGRVLGLVALVVYVASWVLALVFVQRRIARGRSSWWIPLIAGAVANVVVLVCVGSAMMIDPSIAGYIQEMAGTPPTP